jgi:hypothetical protein
MSDDRFEGRRGRRDEVDVGAGLPVEAVEQVK